MAKEKEKVKLLEPEKIPSAKPLLETLEKRKEGLTKAKAAASENGKFNKYHPAYRQALKRLKRVQRRLLKEQIRVTPKHPPKKPAESKEEGGGDA